MDCAKSEYALTFCFYSHPGCLLLGNVLRLSIAFLLLNVALLTTGFSNSVIEHLRGYEGRWVGQFTIHSTANGYTESFPVEQRYWWDDGKLRGLAVMQRDAGMEASSSTTYWDGDQLISEVRRDKRKDRYIGLLHDGGILWLPSEMARANDYQMREVLVRAKGQPSKLMTEGYDTYVYAEGIAHIVYRGELIRQPEAEE